MNVLKHVKRVEYGKETAGVLVFILLPNLLLTPEIKKSLMDTYNRTFKITQELLLKSPVQVTTYIAVMPNSNEFTLFYSYDLGQEWFLL